MEKKHKICNKMMRSYKKFRCLRTLSGLEIMRILSKLRCLLGRAQGGKKFILEPTLKNYLKITVKELIFLDSWASL